MRTFSVPAFFKALVIVNILMHGGMMTLASIYGGDWGRHETIFYIFVAAACVIWSRHSDQRGDL
jgi:hypothetical protein